MRFLLPTLILAVLTLLIFWLMWRSWRRRNDRDRTLAVTEGQLQGQELADFQRVFYVATTPVAAPLERVAVPGLAFRGWARLRVYSDGVEIIVTGERPVTIPARLVEGVTEAQLTIDKVVERDGLSALEWRSDRGALVSNFRFASPEQQHTFARSITDMLRTHPQADTVDLTKETP